MNDLLSGLLKSVAPILATAVAGPLGGAAVSAIASKLGVGDSVEEVAKAIAGDPAATKAARARLVGKSPKLLIVLTHVKQK